MKSRVITCHEDVAEGLNYLCSIEGRFADAAEMVGPLPLRLRDEGFETLLDVIVSQQLSVASADAIWGRLREAGLTDQARLCKARIVDLRQCGLSRRKAEYAKALAEHDLDYRELSELGDRDVVDRLVQIRGIGQWTAEIYAMFALGRADVIAAGDLALQESARMLFALGERPSSDSLREMARPWSPWQSVAARLLWAYYRVASKREGIR